MADKVKRKYLVVSLHDITPAFFPELTEICEELELQKIRRKNLLIIPYYQGKFDISQDDNFCYWLHSLINQGDEPVQHGCKHTLREYTSFKQYLTGFPHGFFASKCAEFRNLKKGNIQRKIGQGKSILQKRDIYCRGFCPPWWAMDPGTDKLLKQEEFEYGTFLSHVMDYRRNLKIKSEAIFFLKGLSGIEARLYNLFLARICMRRRNLARVAIHPSDVHRETLFSSMIDTINYLRKSRTLTTYIDYLTKNFVQGEENEQKGPYK